MVKKRIKAFFITLIIVICVLTPLIVLPFVYADIGRSLIKNTPERICGLRVDEIKGKSDFEDCKYKPFYTQYKDGKPHYSFFFIDVWYSVFMYDGVYCSSRSDFEFHEYRIVVAIHNSEGIVSKVEDRSSTSLTNVFNINYDDINWELLPKPKYEKLHEAWTDYVAFIKALVYTMLAI